MNLTGRPIVQKQPRVHVRSLLSIAKEAPCFATFPHNCTAHMGCDPAHNNWQEFGKGVGIKTSDWLVAFVCRTAHQMLDGKVGLDALPKHLRLHYWIEAFIATHDWLWRERRIKVS